MDHAAIIEKLGAGPVADAVGKTPVNVRVAKNRRSIPRSWWADLMHAFPAITLEMLKSGEGAETDDVDEAAA